MVQPITTVETQPFTVDLAALPPWQRRYLASRQSGLSRDDAAQATNCSPGSIAWHTTPGSDGYDAAFARAVLAVEAGHAVYGLEATRGLARDHVGGLVVDAVRESRDPLVPAQARVQNRRWVGDVAGLGSSAQGGGVTITAQTVNVLVASMTAEQRHAVIRASQAPALPAQVDAVDVTPAPTQARARPRRVAPAELRGGAPTPARGSPQSDPRGGGARKQVGGT